MVAQPGLVVLGALARQQVERPDLRLDITIAGVVPRTHKVIRGLRNVIQSENRDPNAFGLIDGPQRPHERLVSLASLRCRHPRLPRRSIRIGEVLRVQMSLWSSHSL